MPIVKEFDSDYFIQPFTFKKAIKTHVSIGTTKPISVILTQGQGEKKRTCTLNLPMDRQDILKDLKYQDGDMFAWQIQEYKCDIPALYNVLVEDINPSVVNYIAYLISFMEDEEINVVNVFFLKYTMGEHDNDPDAQTILNLILLADEYYESNPEERETFTDEYIHQTIGKNFNFKPPMNLFIA